MSRKSASFEQLYDYFCKDDDVELRGFNIFSNANNREEVIKEFLENSEYLKNSRGKNYLYHEIISLRKNNLSLDEQKAILEDLTFKYLSLRAENHLALTALHSDKEHIHIHLMISANRILENKRTRLSKKKFHNIQQQLEIYTNGNYPQLEPTNHYTRGKTTKKEQLKILLKEAFEKSNSFKSLQNYLEKQSIKIYTRGKQAGVIFDNRKYRLKTLELDTLYNQTLKKFKSSQEKEFKYENEQNQKSKTNTETKFNYSKNDNKIKRRKKEMEELRKFRERQKQNKNWKREWEF